MWVRCTGHRALAVVLQTGDPRSGGHEWLGRIARKSCRQIVENCDRRGKARLRTSKSRRRPNANLCRSDVEVLSCSWQVLRGEVNFLEGWPRRILETPSRRFGGIPP